MEQSKPHEIVNRLSEARDKLRSHIVLETALIERISQLPEDNHCSTDRESLQLGAGYGYLVSKGQALFKHDTYENDPTSVVLHAFYAVRPINRYIDEHATFANRYQVYEAVLNCNAKLPDNLDQYEVTAASMFLEGYLTVVAYFASTSTDLELLG